MVKAVFFDLDDTLLWDKQSIQLAFDKTCKEAQEKYDVDAKALEEAVRAEARELYASYETWDFTQMIGINPFEGLWGDFTDKINVYFRKMKEIVPTYRKEAWTRGLKRLGIDDAAFGAHLGERFPANRRVSPCLYDDTFSVLDKFIEKGYRLLLLTNGASTLQNEKLDITPELVPYFEHIVISGNFGRGKPDPSIFEHALFLMGLSKDEAIMVGDNLKTDILGSNRIGMKNVWINRENNEIVDGIEPTYEVTSLTELFELVETL